MFKNVMISMVIVIILAVIIESWKYAIKQIKKLKRDKEKLELDFELIKYIENKSNSSVPALFVDLIYDGYVTYIKKMTLTLGKTHKWYNISENITSALYIREVTNKTIQEELKGFIQQEIQATLGSVITYYDLINTIGIEDVNKYIDVAMDFIDESLEYQIFCANEVIEFYKRS